MSDNSTLTALLQWLQNFGQRRVNSLLMDERRCITPHVVLEFGNQGLFGLQLGPEYGGLNFSTCDTLAVMRQLGAIDLTLATLVSTHANGMYPVQHHASAALKNRYLPLFAQGRQLCGFGLTEWAAGSNPWAIEMAAQALPDGGWGLQGRKIWVDSGAWASLLTLFAQTIDPQTGLKSMTAFAVPLDSPGVVIEEEALTMGLRGMVQSHISLNHTSVTAQHVLGRCGEGMAIAQEALTVGRLMLAAKSIGAMGHCLQLMVRYASARQVATGLLIANPVIQSWLGELSAKLTAAQTMTWLLGERIDHAQATPPEIFFALKNFAVEALWHSADLALQTLGGRGYMENNILPQILRDARTMRISEGPTETLNMALGASLLNAGAPILDFISTTLGCAQLAQRLQETMQAVAQRCQHPDRGFANRQAALNWCYALLGHVATSTLMLAGVESRLQQHGQDEQLQHSQRYLHAHWQAVVREAMQGSAAEVALLSLPDVTRLIESITASIGTPMQSGSGVDTRLDPLLRPHQSMPGNLAAPSRPALDEFNQPDQPFQPSPFPAPVAVHHLFEQQAAQQGERIAAICGTQQISFAQLDQHANLLAASLLEQGVQAGDFVGLFMDHSLELLVGILGILKAGAAYIPLDPHYPEQRIRFVLQDSALRYLVSRSDLEERLTALSDLSVVWVDLAATPLSSPVASAPGVTVQAGATAYVLYTSGSTGQPKGVRVAHAALFNFLHAMQQQLRLQPHDVVLAHTTVAFDIAGLELFMPLVWGTKMLICPPEMRNDTGRLMAYLAQHQVTLIQATPAFWHLLILNNWQGQRQLTALCGGEALNSDLALQLLDRCGQVWNMYGPTEATIWCAMYRLDESLRQTDDSALPIIPIGKPIANTRFYILDSNLRPVAPGDAGELCIGGANLAQGYWQRPQIEQEKFIETKINASPVRLYRSGDMARLLPDGNVLFMGRLDRQIKIRGYRIEPGEIEHGLRQHPALTDAVVLGRQRSAGDVILVAYLEVKHAGSQAMPTPEIADLRQMLAQHLPPYMIPNRWVFLAAFPLTANGKVDYLALAELALDEQVDAVPGISGTIDTIATAATTATSTATTPGTAQNQVQETLLALWAETLQLPPGSVSIDSNFFAMGGHSLLAAQVVARINQLYAINLSLGQFFMQPHIAALAGQIARQERPLLPIALPVRPARVRLINSQKAILFKLRTMFSHLPEIYNNPTSFMLEGELDLARLESCLRTIFARHSSFSTCFEFEGEQAVSQSWRSDLALPFEQHDLRHLAPDEQAAVWQPLLLETEHAVFDLEQGPLIRAQLIQLAAQRTILQIVIHHAVIDGHSSKLFFDELTALYRQTDAALSPVPPLPIQFSDYAQWEAGWYQGKVAQEYLAYWLDYLKPLPAKLMLPNVTPVAPDAALLGNHAVVLANTTLVSLRRLCLAQESTLFMLLLTAFYRVVGQLGQQHDWVMGYPMANHAVPGTENLMNYFSSTMPLRLRCNGSEDFYDLLKTAKADLAAGLSYGNADFVAIAEELNQVASTECHPIFQIVFLMVEDIDPRFDGIRLSSLPSHPKIAKYDVLLYALHAEDSLDLYFEYRPTTYHADTIAALARALTDFLDQLVLPSAGQIQT